MHKKFNKVFIIIIIFNRVDKCSTFGIKKSLTKSIQYLPKRLINNRLKPATKIGESFRHLGKYFNFNMSDKQYSAADKLWYYKNCAFFEKSMKFLT